MKTKLFGIILLCLPLTLKAQFIKAELEVNGFTCSMCALSTQKALSKLDFIEEIQPDINKNLYYLKFKPGKEVDFSAIQAKVKGSGFSIGKLTTLYRFEKSIHQSVFDYGGFIYQIEKYDQKELTGDRWFQIVDKNFLSPMNYKSQVPFQRELIPNTSLGKGLPNKNQKIFHLIES